MNAKPHIRLTVVSQSESPIDAARRRYGKPFATERGNTHRPRETPLLTEWLSQRVKEQSWT